MNEKVYIFSLVQDIFIMLTALILGIWCLSRLSCKCKYKIPIAVYCFSSFLTTLIHTCFAAVHFQYRLEIHPIEIFIYLEAVFFSYCVYTSIRSKWLRVSIIVLNFTFIIITVLFHLTLERHINSKVVAENFIIIVILAFYYIELFKAEPVKHLKDDPAYWIVNGGLIYFIGTLPLFFALDYIDKLGDQMFFFINYSINTALFFVLALFLYKAVKLDPVDTFDSMIDQ